MFKNLLVFIFLVTGSFSVSAQEEDFDLLPEEEISFEEPTTSEAPAFEFSDNSLNSGTATMPLSEPGEVVLERPIDYTLSYSERRNRWGVTFSANYEQFFPSEYFSLIKNDLYKNYFNLDIPLVGAEFGVKYNFSVGSLALLAGYAQGGIADDTQGLEITAAITKAALNITLDNLFSEPYVAPYGQVGIHMIDWSEVETLGGTIREESFTSDYNYHFKVGMLFQLNWIENKLDPSSRQEALRSSGLENTYIDVFYTYYAEPTQISTAQNEPGEGNLGSGAIGAGLKLEF